LIEQGLTSY